MVVGGLPEGSKDLAGARAQMVERRPAGCSSTAQAAGVRIALEPLHPVYAADRSCLSTLAQALDICERLDPRPAAAPGSASASMSITSGGIPISNRQIARAGQARAPAGFHVCDWLVPTRDPAASTAA